jgi:hypothetical protein
MRTTLSARPKRPMVVMASLALVAFALAGCSDTDTTSGGRNEAPDAQLETDEQVGWSDDTFTFDGSKSEDDDGEIVEWRFKWGDGTPDTVVTREEDADVEHVFPHGGEFTVSLVVTDNGRENEGGLTSTDTVTIGVNEHLPVAGGALYAQPLVGQAANYSQPFEVYEKAGSSEIMVRVVDPENETLSEDTITVAAGQTDQLELEGVLTDKGMHRIEIRADSGGATVAGEMDVIYAEDPTSDE